MGTRSTTIGWLLGTGVGLVAARYWLAATAAGSLTRTARDLRRLRCLILRQGPSSLPRPRKALLPSTLVNSPTFLDFLHYDANYATFQIPYCNLEAG